MGRRAGQLLDDDLMFEAAAAHLARLAPVHNEQVQRHGVDGAHSDELVNAKGQTSSSATPPHLTAGG